jgi:two-component system chemotaxis response regulator CheB
MPGLDGIQALQRIKSTTSIPVIIVSSYTQPGAMAALEALEIGAFDIIPKPVSGKPEDLFEMRDRLIYLVKAAYESTKPVETDLSDSCEKGDVDSPAVGFYRGGVERDLSLSFVFSDAEIKVFEAVGIGCSAGGPLALAKILPLLPSSFPWPIFIVQHMPPFFTTFFAEKLNAKCSLNVKEAEDKEWAKPGNVYIAGGDCHLRIDRFDVCLRLALDSEMPLVSGARPSVDVLFQSMASSIGSKAVGILLSGMGHDGVEGLLKMKESGAVTAVQDRSSSLVYGMPGRALQMGATNRIVDLDYIFSFIYVSARSRVAYDKGYDASLDTISSEDI